MRLWDIRTGSELRRVREMLPGNGAALAVCPDGRHLIAAWDHDLCVWDTRSGQAVARASADEGIPFFSLSVAPDSRHLASVGFDHTVRVWQMPAIPEPPATEETELLQPSSQGMGYLALSTDRKQLAVPGSAGLALWNLSERKPTRSVPASEVGGLSCAAFTPGGRRLVTGGQDHAVRFWDLGAGGPPRVLGRHEHPTVFSLAVSPDGALAATGEEGHGDGSEQVLIHLWDLKSGREREPIRGRLGRTAQLRFLDRRRLLAAHFDYGARWCCGTSPPGPGCSRSGAASTASRSRRLPTGGGLRPVSGAAPSASSMSPRAGRSVSSRGTRSP